MKKRIFAGALALLMIIGLLPVSSMVKKPMEVKASGKTYTFNPAEITIDSTGDVQTVNEVFSFKTADVEVDKFNGTIIDGNNKYPKPSCFRFSGGADFTNNIPAENRRVVINNKKKSIMVLKCFINKANRAMKVVDSNGKDVASVNTQANKNMLTLEVSLDAGTTYYIAPSGGDVCIYSIVITEADEPVATTPSYKVSVVDSESTETISPKDVNEGATFEYTAAGTGDVRWINSNGILVSTTAKLSIPVYYSDTYTAVYGKTGNKVTYYTPYGGELATYYADENFTVPEVPTRYGYKATGWDKDIDSVKEALKSGNVEVRPVYDNDTSLTFSITVDTSAIDGATPKAENVEVNKEIKASVTSDDFAYWSDENGNPLSYNSTYYFLANRDVTVKAVKKSDSGVEKTGVVTYIRYESKTIIFEYTVPDTYTMKFAGVLASTNKAKVESATADNRPAGVYKLGADEAKCSSYKTFRYTLKNNGADTWYTRPVLTYTDDSRVEHTIVGKTVYEMN